MLIGRDGQARGAVVRLPTKNGHRTTLQRPLQLLYLLEISYTDWQDSPPESENQTSEGAENEQPLINNDDDEHRQRPMRCSAQRAQDCCKEWTSQLLDDEKGWPLCGQPGGGCWNPVRRLRNMLYDWHCYMQLCHVVLCNVVTFWHVIKHIVESS